MLSNPPKIVKIDAKFERCVSCGHKRSLVEPKRLNESAKMRQGRFANADNSNLGRFDQMYAARVRQQLCQRARGHPPGGPAADDDDSFTRRGHRLVQL